MKKPSFYQISGILAFISILLFVIAINTDNQFEWLDTAVIVAFIATFVSVPFLMLIGYIFKKRK